MAAEEAACNGGGEARKAELPVIEPAGASTDLKEVEKREDEVVSGNSVVAKGNSGDLSEKISDLDTKPDSAEKVSDLETKPDPAVRGEERAAESNAASAVAVVGDHGNDTAPDASLANGHVCAAAESQVCVESNGEQAAADAVELAEKVDGGEQDGMGVATANGHDHVDMSADSSVAAMQSEDHVEDSFGKQATADVTELTEQEVVSGEQDRVDVSAGHEHGHVDTNDDCSTAAAKSKLYVDQSNGEETAANAMELMGQDGIDGLTANGHGYADTNADACVAAAVFEVQRDESKGQGTVKLAEQDSAIGEQGKADVSLGNGLDKVDSSADSGAVDVGSEVCGDKGQGGESAADVTELVGQETESVEQGVATESVANGHDHANTNADSGGANTQTEVCPDESKVAQIAACDVEIVEHERAVTIEDQGTEGDAKVANSKVTREDNVLSNGHEQAEESADVDAELEPLGEEGQGEATLVVDQLEDRADNDCEEIVQDTGVSGAHETAEEAESQVEERKDEAGPDVTELKERFEKTNEEILQGNELAKDDVDVSSLQPAELVSYSTVEVEEEVAMEPACLEEASLVSIQEQTAGSFQEIEQQKQLETPGNHIGDKIDDDKLDAELKQEPNMEVVDGTQLQATSTAVVSAFHNEPRSLLLADSDRVGVEHSTPASELETPDNAPGGGNCSEENFSAAVAHVEVGASKEHETVGVDQAEPSSQTRFDSALVVRAEDSSSKDKPHDIGNDDVQSAGHTRDPHSENIADASSPDDQLDVSNISSPCDAISSGNGHRDSSPINEPASSIEKPCHSHGVLENAPSPDDDTCLLDRTCNEIPSQNAIAFTKASHEVETRYVKAVESTPVDKIVRDEHKDDDEQEYNNNTKIVKDSSDSQLEIDIDKENEGGVQVITPQRIYIIKVPRFAGEDLWAKLQDAQIHLDQLTQKRDAINVLRQKQKALCDEYREKLEAARQEERGARAAHGDKRQDLNSVQSMIGKLNKANSIEEIDEMIAMKDKIIAHESISLKEEKLLLQEIKELKAQRKQLFSNMGSKAEINEAFHQKDHIHERHKTLKKDSDELFNNLKSLEEKTKVIYKAYDDERAALRKLNEEHRAANEIRQKAYNDWFELKLEPGKKNKYFFMYKKDRNTASDYLSMGDMVGLQLYCNNQVERFMEMWNKDGDFRRQYVESNKISTLRRLGTSDGRRLGPDELPPEIPSNSNRKPINPALLPVSSPGVSISASEAMPAKSTSAVTSVEEDSFPVLQGSQNSKQSKSKVPGSFSEIETAGAPVPGREDLERIEKEKIHGMEEELELTRQAKELAVREEELRREKAAAEKERLRLEQKAKAKEAEERKRRKAEKAQERADYRARKEAEIIEKKKAKKDKKKGATSVDSVNGSGEGNTQTMATNDTDSSMTESTREADVPQQTAPKRPSRPSVVVKRLNRVEPIPLPLRNRAKRKMRQYILVAVAVLSVLALFVAGNYVSFSSLRMSTF